MVEAGDRITSNRLTHAEGSEFACDRVLLGTDGATTVVGAPAIEKAQARCRVLRHFRGPKIDVYTYQSKKATHRWLGHRQDLTDMEVVELEVPGLKTTKAEAAPKPKKKARAKTEEKVEEPKAEAKPKKKAAAKPKAEKKADEPKAEAKPKKKAAPKPKAEAKPAEEAPAKEAEPKEE